MIRTKLNLDFLDYGHTNNILIQIKSKLYYVDVCKNWATATVDIYDYKSGNRNEYSKYGDANLVTVTVKEDAYLNEFFFANVKEIAEAQQVYGKWRSVLV